MEVRTEEQLEQLVEKLQNDRYDERKRHYKKCEKLKKLKSELETEMKFVSKNYRYWIYLS